MRVATRNLDASTWPRLRTSLVIPRADGTIVRRRAGDWIAFSLSGGERPGIYLVRPDGRALHRIAALWRAIVAAWPGSPARA